MICPNCRTRVSDDAVICDSCDFIIDATFLGNDITNDGKPKATADDGNTKVKALADDSRAKVKPMAAAAAMAAPEPVVGETFESADDRRRSLSTMAAVPASVSESIYELVERFKAFPRSERFSTIAAVVFVVSLGLPWRWTEAEDDIIGFAAGAWPMGLLAVYIAVAPYLRRIQQMRPYKAHFVTGVTVASALLAIGTLLYVSHSVARETIHVFGHGHAATAWKMTPHVGSLIGLLAGFVMLGAGLIMLVERDRLSDA